MKRTSVIWVLFCACVLSACEQQPVETTADEVLPTDSLAGYRAVADWPQLPAGFLLGEVAGVDVDSHGHLFVFQRAARGWDTGATTPIAEATVLQLDAVSGRLLASWGAGLFRLPHGLTVDRQDNIWLTDAGLHQVFQLTHDGVALKTVGEAGVARWDDSHFNRPTDVTVRADGGFYVSDGYENQRVVELDARGAFVREWGRAGSGNGEFALPHGITSRAELLYVADRENGRVEVFDSSGAFRRSWTPAFSARVFAVDVADDGNVYVALREDLVRIGGIVRLANDGRITHALGAVPGGTGEFLAVHDFAVASDGAVYIAENVAGGLRKYLPVKTSTAH
jgi:peptidylamidoglycolate lyase